MRKLRLTGGEPLVRRNIMWLVEQLGRHLRTGALEELTLTTNGSQLAALRRASWRGAGVRRINVSLDTLDPDRFQRDHPLGQVRQGDGRHRGGAGGRPAGQDQRGGAEGVNEDELDRMIALVRTAEGFDLTLIETMPMGEIDGDRTEQYLPLSLVRARLARALDADRHLPYRTGGPARYVRVEETGGRLGFITPLTHNFCESCNRVRVTCTGTMYMCLGQEDAADLRGAAARLGGRRAAQGRDPGRHRAQAQGPRLHHRPPPQAAGRARGT